MKFRIGSIIIIILFLMMASSGKGVLWAFMATQDAPPPTRQPTKVPITSPVISGCPVFPADNPWNQNISKLPIDPNSAKYIASINDSDNKFLHADFGSNPDYGI